MKLGIGLPASIPGASGLGLIEWVLRADAGPFSSLGTIDRLVFPNHDTLMALAAAAAVTRRIRLMTTILLAPLHNAGMLAKQAASLDSLSGGRLTLGLSVGGREDDFKVAGVDVRRRGRVFDEQLEILHRLWAGEPYSEEVGPVGPPPVQPGGPEILIGGGSQPALRRLAKWGAGFIAGGAPPEMAAQFYQLVEQVWREAGRAGKPRFVGGMYVAAGEEVKQRGGDYLRQYYAFSGDWIEGVAQALPVTRDALKARIQEYIDVGMDELILWPTVPDPDQVERLAELIA